MNTWPTHEERAVVTDTLEVHQLEWVHWGRGYECGCNERVPSDLQTLPALLALSDALGHQSDYITEALSVMIARREREAWAEGYSTCLGDFDIKARREARSANPHHNV